MLIALRHERRRRVLKVMIDRRRISPREIADELDDSLGNVGYHVRVLVELGIAVLVDEIPVRGAIQHFYEAPVEEPWVLDLLERDENLRSTRDGEDDEPAA